MITVLSLCLGAAIGVAIALALCLWLNRGECTDWKVRALKAEKDLGEYLDALSGSNIKCDELRERAIKAKRERDEAQTARDAFEAAATAAQEGQLQLIQASDKIREGMHRRLTRILGEINDFLEAVGDHTDD